MSSRRVLVAMSGGVDSSVAAALCQQAGDEVTGVTLKLWGGPQDKGCCAVSDTDDARRVCQQLGIDHFVFNYADEFSDRVVEPYVATHAAGFTPNPCIACNRYVKFDLLAERARQLGFDRLVTGHHVRVENRHLLRGFDADKDQSYVLYMLSADDLELLEFPVGSKTKQQVREHAAALGLRTAAKPDSQDVCFITAAQGREGFLTERLALHPAELVDTAGEVVGQVPAVELVTVGQRKGLGLGGNADRRYAIDVDVARRRVTVGGKAELNRTSVALTDHRWISGVQHVGEVLAQTSAHGTASRATLDTNGQLRWHESQPGVAPGQAVVFYNTGQDAGYRAPQDAGYGAGEAVLGGATASRD